MWNICRVKKRILTQKETIVQREIILNNNYFPKMYSIVEDNSCISKLEII